MRRRGTPQDLDAPEWAPSTVGAQPQAVGQRVEEEVVVCIGLRLRGDGSLLGLSEREATAREQASSAGVGEKSVMTDAHEALREDVEQEAARELAERKCKGPDSPAAVVLVAEGDGHVIDVEEPMVRDRDAVGVAGKIREHVFGVFERRLGIDDPLGAICLLEKALERR